MINLVIPLLYPKNEITNSETKEVCHYGFACWRHDRLRVVLDTVHREILMFYRHDLVVVVSRCNDDIAAK